jgi:hypothetical protein
MARKQPSVIPPKVYRHFALVTVLLTAGIAMFADSENREASAQVAPRESGLRQESIPKPLVAPRTTRRKHHFAQDGEGFAAPFGAPMDEAPGSLVAQTTQLAPDAAPAGYSDHYLASLGPDERRLLLEGLEKEGLLSPEEREHKSRALIAASQARSGGSAAND